MVLNRIAHEVIDRQHGNHSKFVFTYRGHPIDHMLNNGCRRARRDCGLSVRIHDLKHTFGRRLRAAGVSFEDRQDLLGHKSSRITTHYSVAELMSLWKAANTVCEENRHNVSLTVLRTAPRVGHAKVTQRLLKA